MPFLNSGCRKFFQMHDVNQDGGPRHTHIQHSDKGLTTRQNARLITFLEKNIQNLFDLIRTHIIENWRFQNSLRISDRNQPITLSFP